MTGSKIRRKTADRAARKAANTNGSACDTPTFIATHAKPQMKARRINATNADERLKGSA